MKKLIAAGAMAVLFLSIATSTHAAEPLPPIGTVEPGGTLPPDVSFSPAAPQTTTTVAARPAAVAAPGFTG